MSPKKWEVLDKAVYLAGGHPHKKAKKYVAKNSAEPQGPAAAATSKYNYVSPVPMEGYDSTNAAAAAAAAAYEEAPAPVDWFDPSTKPEPFQYAKVAPFQYEKLDGAAYTKSEAPVYGDEPGYADTVPFGEYAGPAAEYGDYAAADTDKKTKKKKKDKTKDKSKDKTKKKTKDKTTESAGAGDVDGAAYSGYVYGDAYQPYADGGAYAGNVNAGAYAGNFDGSAYPQFVDGSADAGHAEPAKKSKRSGHGHGKHKSKSKK
ncbi:hypothetical protein BT67DRAFT_36627 [Trichocladium antarcticum]|uniref:Uncharacterized protein n=1 Tax=Trichocladium antarcticum TaxID=1450529 RepID=A0AAN6ZDM3_9PEZI|nr:hypothetical protein BT67DRAFT_36627 [Trichocladium antarcticum]